MEEGELNILLIEDNPFDARLIQELFKEANNTLTHVKHVDRLSNGMEAIDAERFDAIFVDLSLPDVHGLETVTGLIDKVPHLPVIVLTGYDDEESAVKAVQAGAQDYLVKNKINSEDLSRTLRFALERKKIQQDIYQQYKCLKLIVDNPVMAIGAFDKNGNILYANNTLKKYLFLFLNQVPEKNTSILPFLRGQKGSEFRDYFQKALEGDKIYSHQNFNTGGLPAEFMCFIQPLYNNESITGCSLIAFEHPAEG